MSLTREGFLNHPGIHRQLENFKVRHQEIEKILEQGDVYKDPKASKELLIEFKKLEEILKLEGEFRDLGVKLEECLLLEDDEDMKDLVVAEKEELNKKLDKVFFNLQFRLIPKDNEDVKNVMMEIRAGTGGGEASLFVADLFRLYTRFSEKKGWTLEVLSSSETELKGFKEIVFSIVGADVYEHLKYETGAHRVQRIPETETSGRIHTSAVTVAVFPEVEEAEVEIHDKDLKVDTYRASGAGGQHVNTTDSAIRITHIPTNVVVTCQDERSQLKNKAKAMKILRSRIYEENRRRQKESMDSERRSQVGSGDRSEKVRTYNFPQGRITEHRTHFTLYKLQAAMEGDIDEIIDSLRKLDLEQKMSAMIKS